VRKKSRRSGPDKATLILGSCLLNVDGRPFCGHVKIAFHAPRGSFLSPEPGGGDRVMTRNLIDALTERGHQVEIVSRLDARDLYRGRLAVRDVVREALTIRRRMRAYAADAWLVYGASVTYPDFFGWWLRPRRYVLYAAHRGKPERLPRRWRPLFVLAHRRSLVRADAITVWRPASAIPLSGAGAALDKVHALPPAPRAWANMPSRNEARLRLELPLDAPVVLCLARFPERAKHGKTEMALTLLRVVAELPEEVVLLLVGDSGSGRRQVEDEIEKLRLQARVRFVGPEERERLMGTISNEDVPWFYAAADVYAYPHLHDQPWLSLVEAQACGRPVVTMRTGSSELLIRHNETGLLAADMDSFRTYLLELLNDPARREAMGRAAYAHVASNLSMARHMDRMEALLTDADR
jgi:glycosyltransferase involved in cell wall biosynthesis